MNSVGIPRLVASLETGEGDVRFPKDWENWSSLLRADLLKDWIGVLTNEYEKSFPLK
jgi:hypothetical protein